jgi:trimethylamine--corrinoid protein Co-methyltransferase
MRANYQVNATPQFRVLTDDQIEEIVQAGLDVLSRVGTRIHAQPGVELLEAAGCAVSDGNRVRIPAWMVQDALTTTPRRIVVAGRDRAKRIALEKNRISFGTGSDCPSLVDPCTDEVRKYTYQDVYNAARISDALQHIDFHMSLGLTSGVPAQTYDRHQFRAMLQGTSKPLVITAVDVEGLADQYRMACAVLGSAEEFGRMPLFLAYIEPSSPLSHSKEAVDKILCCAELGIPAIYTPCILAGGTGPATMAGLLVQALAESMVGIVLAQLKRRGAAVLVGGVNSPMDMMTSILSYGAPELALVSAAMTDVSKWLGVPMFSTAGCSDAKVLDEQAAIEATLSIVLAALSGASLIHDVGFLESALLGSYDMLVMSDEVIGMAKHILGGVRVTPETLAVDVIERVGPAGHFLTQEHTRQHFRQEMWFPTLMDRQMRRAWETSGGLTMAERIRSKVLKILDAHQPVPIPAPVEASLAEILATADAEYGG